MGSCLPAPSCWRATSAAGILKPNPSSVSAVANSLGPKSTCQTTWLAAARQPTSVTCVTSCSGTGQPGVTMWPRDMRGNSLSATVARCTSGGPAWPSTRKNVPPLNICSSFYRLKTRKSVHPLNTHCFLQTEDTEKCPPS